MLRWGAPRRATVVQVKWPWKQPGTVPDLGEPAATTAPTASREPVMVLGRVPLSVAGAADDHGASFAHPRGEEGEEDLTVCPSGHLVEIDGSLQPLPALGPGDVLVRAHEETGWVRRNFRSVGDLDGWIADPTGWNLGEPAP